MHIVYHLIKKLKEFLFKHNIRSIDSLANLFEISKKSMEIRIKEGENMFIEEKRGGMLIVNMTKDDLVVLYIISKLNKKKLLKLPIGYLVYKCELYSVDVYGKKITKFKFIHREKGPQDKNLKSIIKKLSLIESNEYLYYLNYLPNNIKKIIDEALDKWLAHWKNKNIHLRIEKLTEDLKSYIYLTYPFLNTPFNQEIDLMQYGKDSGISKLLIPAEELKKIEKYAHLHKEGLIEFITS